MANEVAAAILTRIYFDKIEGRATHLPGAAGDEGAIALASADKIGRVYGHFWAKLGTYMDWATAKGK